MYICNICKNKNMEPEDKSTSELICQVAKRKEEAVVCDFKGQEGNS